jgi:hypothetical protein
MKIESSERTLWANVQPAKLISSSDGGHLRTNWAQAACAAVLLLLGDLASEIEFPSKNDISSLFSLNKYRRKADRIFSRREAKMAASFLFYYHYTFFRDFYTFH